MINWKQISTTDPPDPNLITSTSINTTTNNTSSIVKDTKETNSELLDLNSSTLTITTPSNKLNNEGMVDLDRGNSSENSSANSPGEIEGNEQNRYNKTSSGSIASTTPSSIHSSTFKSIPLNLDSSTPTSPLQSHPARVNSSTTTSSSNSSTSSSQNNNNNQNSFSNQSSSTPTTVEASRAAFYATSNSNHRSLSNLNDEEDDRHFNEAVFDYDALLANSRSPNLTSNNGGSGRESFEQVRGNVGLGVSIPGSSSNQQRETGMGGPFSPSMSSSSFLDQQQDNLTSPRLRRRQESNAQANVNQQFPTTSNSSQSESDHLSPLLPSSTSSSYFPNNTNNSNGNTLSSSTYPSSSSLTSSSSAGILSPLSPLVEPFSPSFGNSSGFLAQSISSSSNWGLDKLEKNVNEKVGGHNVNTSISSDTAGRSTFTIQSHIQQHQQLHQQKQLQLQQQQQQQQQQQEEAQYQQTLYQRTTSHPSLSTLSNYLPSIQTNHLSSLQSSTIRSNSQAGSEREREKDRSTGVYESSLTPNPHSVSMLPSSSSLSSVSNNNMNNGNGQEEISTIFVVGFPEDIQEREFQNMFLFSVGFEAATLKIPQIHNNNGGGGGVRDLFVGTSGGFSTAPSSTTSSSQDPFSGMLGMDSSTYLDDVFLESNLHNSPSLLSLPTPTTSTSNSNLNSINLATSIAVSNNNRNTKQIIGFAKFRTRTQALDARDLLSGKKVGGISSTATTLDVNNTPTTSGNVNGGYILKAEMAKKNLHTKRVGAGAGGSIPPPSLSSGNEGFNSSMEVNNLGRTINSSSVAAEQLASRQQQQRASVATIGSTSGMAREYYDEPSSPTIASNVNNNNNNSAVNATSNYYNLPRVDSSRRAYNISRDFGTTSNTTSGGFEEPTSPRQYQSSVPSTTRNNSNLLLQGSFSGNNLLLASLDETSTSTSPIIDLNQTQRRSSILQSQQQQQQQQQGPSTSSSTNSFSDFSHNNNNNNNLNLNTNLDQQGYSFGVPNSPTSPTQQSLSSGGVGRLGSLTGSLNLGMGMSGIGLGGVMGLPRTQNPADMNAPKNTLYVGGLPAVLPSLTGPFSATHLEDSLRNAFCRCPGFRRLSFRSKSNGPIVFVEFEDVLYATRAMSEMYGNTLGGLVKGGIRLSYSKNPLNVRSGSTAGLNSSIGGGSSNLISGNDLGFGGSYNNQFNSNLSNSIRRPSESVFGQQQQQQTSSSFEYLQLQQQQQQQQLLHQQQQLQQQLQQPRASLTRSPPVNSLPSQFSGNSNSTFSPFGYDRK